MKELLITELVANISKIYSNIDIDKLQRILITTLDTYHVEKKTTEIAIYEPIPKLVEEYIFTKLLEGSAKSTAKMYKNVLIKFFNSINLKVEEVDATNIKMYMYKLENTLDEHGNHINRSTINLYTTIIKSFFNWCTQNDKIVKNPCTNIKPIKYNRVRKHALKNDEMTLFRSKCTTVEERMFVEVMYSTACRVGEFCSITLDKIDLNNKTIEIYNQKCQRWKTCYLTDDAVYWLKKYIKEYREIPKDGTNRLVVSKRLKNSMTISGVERVIAKISSRCNLPNKVTPHIFRHTCATDVVNRGGTLEQAKILLDHKNISTTMIYAETDKEKIQEIHDSCLI